MRLTSMSKPGALAGLALAGMLALPIAATAGSITVSDSGGGTTSARFETQVTGYPGYSPISPTGTSNADGYHNGNVFLAAGQYTLEYWGSGDSLFTNTFTLVAAVGYSILSGGPIVSVGIGGAGGISGSPIQLDVTNPNGAMLSFTYSTSAGCTIGSGAPVGTACNYIAGVDGVPVVGASTNGTVGYLGFSDRREGIDTDHQDLTVRITVVPEPGSLALLGAGLIGLAVARRRRASA